MKIVICGIFYYPDLIGVAKYTGEMAEWLQSRGHRVRVITAYPFYPAWRIRKGYPSWRYCVQNISGVTIIRCPIWVPKTPSGLTRLLHLISYAVSSLPIILWQVLWRPKAFIAIEPTFFCIPGTLVASRLSRARSWVHIQDFEIDIAFSLGLLSTSTLKSAIGGFESWILSKYDRISTISERMIDHLKEKKIVHAIPLLFPNWVDTKRIYPQKHNNVLRTEMGILNNQVVVLYSGNWGEKQGLEVLIEAARRMQDQKRIIFVFCGEGAAYKRIKKAARDLVNVRWINLQPEHRLNDLLNLADIHLLPQRGDAADLVMPSKLTGMLASGKSILATAMTGTQVFNLLSEIVTVVPPGKIDEFVVALKGLVENEGKRRIQGDRARRYAINNLDKEVILSEFERELLACDNDKRKKKCHKKCLLKIR